MIGGIGIAAKAVDMGLGIGRNRQPGMSADREGRGVGISGDIFRLDNILCLIDDQKGRQQRSVARQFHRRDGGFWIGQRLAAKRPFHRILHVEHRIDNRDNLGGRDRRSKADLDRQVRIGGGELVEQFERRRTAGGDQQRHGSGSGQGRLERARFHRQQIELLATCGHANRPAPAQRINRASRAAGRCLLGPVKRRCLQNSNSVIRGA